MKPVSVVIPVFNGANYIAQAIESVLKQDYNNINLHVINSLDTTDSTESIVKQYHGVYLHHGGHGCRNNWQASLDVADGEYVKLLCHDDILYPKCISRQVEELDADNSLSFVSCHKRYIDADGHKIVESVQQYHDKKIAGRDVAWMMLRNKNFIGDSACILWRNNKITLPKDMNWLLDLYMWMILATKGNFLYIADYLADIRRHPEQDTHRCLSDKDYQLKESSDMEHLKTLYCATWSMM